MRYRPDLVRDLNAKALAACPRCSRRLRRRRARTGSQLGNRARPRPRLSLRTEAQAIDRRWDVVVLQATARSTRSGRAIRCANAEAAGLLTAMLRRANPRVRVELVSTWSRADLTYRTASPWRGKPITAMADDLATGNAYALRRFPEISGTIPVARLGTELGRSGLPIRTLMTVSPLGRSICGAGTSITPARRAIIWRRCRIRKDHRVRRPAAGEQERAGIDLGLEPRLIGRLQAIAHSEVTGVTP